VLHNLHATPSGSRYAFAAPPAPAHAGPSVAPLLPPRRPRFGAPVPRRSVEEAWDLQVRERRSAYVDDRWALVSGRSAQHDLLPAHCGPQHVGSNRASGYSATPSPSAIAQSSAAQARLSAFLHRELYALPLGGGTATGLDVPFLRAYIAALARTVSLRSDEAVRLLHAFLQPHTEHFLHELDCYMRSNRGLREWDRSVSYLPLGSPAPGNKRRRSREAPARRTRRQVDACTPASAAVAPTAAVGLSASEQEPPSAAPPPAVVTALADAPAAVQAPPTRAQIALQRAALLQRLDVERAALAERAAESKGPSVASLPEGQPAQSSEESEARLRALAREARLRLMLRRSRPGGLAAT
jgi:hypothetical protein